VHLLAELSDLAGHVVELDRKGGPVIEAAAEIAAQLLVVEAVLSTAVIASIAIAGSSAVLVSAAAVVNREPSTTMSAPQKVDRAPRKVLRSIVKLTRASGKLRRYVISDGNDRAKVPRACVRAPRAAVCDPRC
jgi:hypothetical protein